MIGSTLFVEFVICEADFGGCTLLYAEAPCSPEIMVTVETEREPWTYDKITSLVGQLHRSQAWCNELSVII